MEGWEGGGGYRGEQQPFGLCLHHSCNDSKRCPQQLFASARVHVLLRVMYAGTKLCKLVPSTHVLSMVTSVCAISLSCLWLLQCCAISLSCLWLLQCCAVHLLVIFMINSLLYHKSTCMMFMINSALCPLILSLWLIRC